SDVREEERVCAPASLMAASLKLGDFLNTPEGTARSHVRKMSRVLHQYSLFTNFVSELIGSGSYNQVTSFKLVAVRGTSNVIYESYREFLGAGTRCGHLTPVAQVRVVVVEDVTCVSRVLLSPGVGGRAARLVPGRRYMCGVQWCVAAGHVHTPLLLQYHQPSTPPTTTAPRPAAPTIRATLATNGCLTESLRENQVNAAVSLGP
ncbi:hypothetical protein Hamer_G020665, partial [Homarus americanus]